MNHTQVLVQSLEDVRNEKTVLSLSWDIAMDNCSEEELGNMFHDTLFELAPNLRFIYRKPRQVCASSCFSTKSMAQIIFLYCALYSHFEAETLITINYAL
jgi:hypothetical protein